MKISYQYANRANASVLLKIDGVLPNQTVCILIDSGLGVDVNSLLDDDEYLTAILLTHVHRDHISTLNKNLNHGAKIYTSPTNKELLTPVLQSVINNTGQNIDIDEITSAVEPSDETISIVNGLSAIPVPAGHTPGATGFYLKFEDRGEENTILITGDFTRRDVAGYPGLPIHHADSVILTGATSHDFQKSITKATSEALQHGLSGSPTLISASSLNGIHFAYLLGNIVEKYGHKIGISIVGQAAKLYNTLEYEVPNVSSYPEYGKEEILDQNDITISSPSVPTKGGSKYLLNQIREDPNASLIQLINTNDGDIGKAKCTVNHFPFVNHPNMTTIENLIEMIGPEQVVITHQTGRSLSQYQDKFSTVVWAPSNDRSFVIYDNGWQSPHWITDRTKRLYNSQSEQVKLPKIDSSPALFERGKVNIAAEGVFIEEVFGCNSPDDQDTKYTTDPTQATPVQDTKRKSKS